MPLGIFVSADGTIHGRPTGSDVYAFSIVVSDDMGNMAEHMYNVTVNAAAALALSPDALPETGIGKAYAVRIEAAGGSGVYDEPRLHSGGPSKDYSLLLRSDLALSTDRLPEAAWTSPTGHFSKRAAGRAHIPSRSSANPTG